MSIHRTKITTDGRIQLPASLRKELGLHAGDTLDLEVHDGQFVVRRPSRTLEDIRSLLAPYLNPEDDLQADLKAMRVEDAQRG